MKKIKVLFVAAALTLGVGSAFAFVDDAACSQPVPGYTQNPTGLPNPNIYLIPGTFGSNYSCQPEETETCRWVRNAQGVYVECKGHRIQL